MIFRFFVVLYILAAISIAGVVVYFIATEFHPFEVKLSTYWARCLSNDQPVILQGGSEPWEYSERELHDDPDANARQINFYCKYYDQVQPHIQQYLNSKTVQQQFEANSAFVEFEENQPFVASYPKLYKLEEKTVENNFTEPIMILGATVLFGLILFLVLQALRIICLYIVFGELIWHPFKKPKSLKI